MVVVGLAISYQQSGFVGRCCGHRHVFEGDVIGAVEFDGAVVGVTSVTGDHHLLVVASHASEDHTVGGAGTSDLVNGDVLLVSAGSYLKNYLTRDACRQSRDGCAE